MGFLMDTTPKNPMDKEGLAPKPPEVTGQSGGVPLEFAKPTESPKSPEVSPDVPVYEKREDPITHEEKKEHIKLTASVNPPPTNDPGVAQAEQILKDEGSGHEEKVTRLVTLALSSGPGVALKELHKTNDAWLIDRVHDELAKDDNYSKLKAANHI